MSISFDDQSVMLILFTGVILWLMYLCRMYFASKATGQEPVSDEPSKPDSSELKSDPEV